MSKSNWLVFADLHLTNSNSNFKIGERGVSDLLVAQKNFVEDLCEKYRQGDYEGILFLGDWTDDATIDPVVQTYSNECLSMINEFDGNHIAITGNHTVYDKDNVYTILGAADKAFENIEFINTSKKLEFDDINFYCLPYSSNYQQVENQIEEYADNVDSNKFNVLLFHFPIKGAKLDNDFESKDGVRYVQSDWGRFDLAIGGDFHRRQHIAQDAYYVGAPFDLKFGEHMERGAQALSISARDYSLEVLDNPYQYNLVTYEKVDKELDTGSRDVLRFKGDFDETQKAEVKSTLDDSDCYSHSFSITTKDEEVNEAIDNFDFLQGGDNLDLLKNYLNESDISDNFYDDCVNLIQEVI